MEKRTLLAFGLIVGIVLAAIVYAAAVLPKPVSADAGVGACGAGAAGGCYANSGDGAGLAAVPATYAPAAVPNRSREELELQADAGVRTVELGFDWGYGNYDPQEIRVRVGDRVRIEADTSELRGCMSTLVINGMGVSKRITVADNVLEFTAGAPGQYRLTCGMGMGNGLLIVEDQYGNVPAGEAAAPARTGGCGCGG